MKKIALYTSLFVLALVLVFSLSIHTAKRTNEEAIPEAKQEALSNRSVALASVPLSPLSEPAKDKLAQPPSTGKLALWDWNGQLSDEVIARYELTSRQVAELKALKEELAKRMLSIDLAHALIQIAPDRKSLTVTIKADPAAAKEFTDFYHAGLENVFGARNYADLAKYLLMPTTDQIANAGLQDKDIEIQKVATNDSQPEYHIKSESRLKVSPPGWPAAYDSNTIETTGNRDKIAIAYAGVPFILPSDI